MHHQTFRVIMGFNVKYVTVTDLVIKSVEAMQDFKKIYIN